VPDNAPAALAFGNSDQTPLSLMNASDPTVTGIGTFSRITSVGNVTAVGENAIVTLSPTGSSGTVNIQPDNGGTLSNLDVEANILTAADAVTLSPANAAVTLAPSGSGGIVVINPGTTGLIDNVDIGTITPGIVSTDDLRSSGGTINNTVIEILNQQMQHSVLVLLLLLQQVRITLQTRSMLIIEQLRWL